MALVGSAASDILGFLVISQSRMGFFSLFGMFSAAMILFSLIASLILATALIGLLNKGELKHDLKAAGTWQQMQHLAEEEVSQAVAAIGSSGESSVVEDGEE